MNLDAIQSALRDQHLDGWLFYDHHHRDPIAYRILGLPDSFVSRRWYYFVPAHGEPRKLVHRIESGKLDRLPGTTRQYSSWQELEQNLAEMLEGSTKIAMQYSPRNAIMYVAMVDAGTVELLRSLGKDIVTSADLVSLFEAVLTEDQIATHYAAQERLDRVLAAGWKFITDRTRPGDHTSEFEVITFFLQAMEREGLWTDHGPNCSVGPNSADSHYEPTELRAAPIFHGDFVLIDIWAKLSEPHDHRVAAVPMPSGTTSPGPASSAASPPTASATSSPPSAPRATPPSPPSSRLTPPTGPSPAGRPTTPPATSSAALDSKNSSRIAPGTTSPPSCTATERISTTSRRTTNVCCCPTPASPLSPVSTSPVSSASAVR